MKYFISYNNLDLGLRYYTKNRITSMLSQKNINVSVLLLRGTSFDLSPDHLLYKIGSLK